MTMTASEAESTFRTDPAKARTNPTVTATLANGRARLSAGQFNWDADLSGVLGGENLAPSPTAYMLGALAGCAVAFLRDTLAPQFGVEIDDVTAVAGASSDLRGLLGIDGAAPSLTDLKLDIQVVTGSPADRVEAMFAAWRERCPIYLALLHPNQVALTTGASAAPAAAGGRS
jgi:uncharacterized OsmC-like protein